MNLDFLNKEIKIPVWGILLVIILFGVIYTCLGSNNDANKKIEKELADNSSQIIEFYENNEKMPQLVLGANDEFFYDTEHIMLIKNIDNKRYVAITNYKNDAMEDADEIWDFVDMFQTETKGINRIIYRYGDKTIVLSRDQKD